MSYSGIGLLRAGGLGRGLGAGASDPRDTSTMVPPQCAQLAHYRMPPATIDPSQTIVVAFPFVTGPASKMPAVLAQILGSLGEGGPVLQSMVAMQRSYSFMTGGFIRDDKSNQALTKGTIWLAMSPTAPRSSAALRQDAKLTLEAALRAEGMRASRAMPPQSDINMVATWSAVALGHSDEELLHAVYSASAGAAEFGAFIRFVGAAARAGRQAATLTGAIVGPSQRMQSAVSVVQGIDTTVSMVRGVVTRALAMGADQQAAAAELLNQAKADVAAKLSLIRESVTAAPTFVEQLPAQREAILRTVRMAILDVAEADIQRGSPLEIAREYLRCALLARTKQEIDVSLVAIETAIDQGAVAGQWLLNNAPAIEDAVAKLERLDKLIDEAFNQLPLGFWLRKRWGLPTWGWGVVGGGVFVTSAFGLRALKKKRRKS